MTTQLIEGCPSTRAEVHRRRLTPNGPWSALYDAHYVRLVRLAVLLLGDVGRAEEVVQDSFVAVHRRWDKLSGADVPAYLRQTVVNRSRSVLRHLPWSSTARAARTSRDEPGADHDVLRGRTTPRGRRRDGRLPRRQREVLALRYYLDLSEREIAETLEISQGAVKSHASRGAAALRRSLSPLLEETYEHDSDGPTCAPAARRRLRRAPRGTRRARSRPVPGGPHRRAGCRSPSPPRPPPSLVIGGGAWLAKRSRRRTRPPPAPTSRRASDDSQAPAAGQPVDVHGLLRGRDGRRPAAVPGDPPRRRRDRQRRSRSP